MLSYGVLHYTASKKQTKHFMLQEKVEVMHKAKANPKLSLKFRESFLKGKAEILDLYVEDTTDRVLQLTRKRACKSTFVEVNESLQYSKAFIPQEISSVKNQRNSSQVGEDSF